ncbi:hypothetical protein HMI56_000622 [Coelomomyces lativittatus]|nr:hypothetical protein HMI56_000622 [Coelomomyces lativittatus]
MDSLTDSIHGVHFQGKPFYLSSCNETPTTTTTPFISNEERLNKLCEQSKFLVEQVEFALHGSLFSSSASSPFSSSTNNPSALSRLITTTPTKSPFVKFTTASFSPSFHSNTLSHPSPSLVGSSSSSTTPSSLTPPLTTIATSTSTTTLPHVEHKACQTATIDVSLLFPKKNTPLVDDLNMNTLMDKVKEPFLNISSSSSHGTTDSTTSLNESAAVASFQHPLKKELTSTSSSSSNLTSLNSLTLSLVHSIAFHLHQLELFFLHWTSTFSSSPSSSSSSTSASLTSISSPSLSIPTPSAPPWNPRTHEQGPPHRHGPWIPMPHHASLETRSNPSLWDPTPPPPAFLSPSPSLLSLPTTFSFFHRPPSATSPPSTHPSTVPTGLALIPVLLPQPLFSIAASTSSSSFPSPMSLAPLSNEEEPLPLSSTNTTSFFSTLSPPPTHVLDLLHSLVQAFQSFAFHHQVPYPSPLLASTLFKKKVTGPNPSVIPPPPPSSPPGTPRRRPSWIHAVSQTYKRTHEPAPSSFPLPHRPFSVPSKGNEPEIPWPLAPPHPPSSMLPLPLEVELQTKSSSLSFHGIDEPRIPTAWKEDSFSSSMDPSIGRRRRHRRPSSPPLRSFTSSSSISIQGLPSPLLPLPHAPLYLKEGASFPSPEDAPTSPLVSSSSLSSFPTATTLSTSSSSSSSSTFPSFHSLPRPFSTPSTSFMPTSTSTSTSSTQPSLVPYSPLLPPTRLPSTSTSSFHLRHHDNVVLVDQRPVRIKRVE